MKKIVVSFLTATIFIFCFDAVYAAYAKPPSAKNQIQHVYVGQVKEIHYDPTCKCLRVVIVRLLASPLWLTISGSKTSLKKGDMGVFGVRFDNTAITVVEFKTLQRKPE